MFNLKKCKHDGTFINFNNFNVIAVIVTMQTINEPKMAASDSTVG